MSTNTLSQCLFGLKIIDADAINPLIGEPIIRSIIEDSDGEPKTHYHGDQSTQFCVVAGAVMAKEKEGLKSDCFKRIIECTKTL